MPVGDAKERIGAALLSWSGITAQPHRFGGTEYRLGRREIGIYLRQASGVDRAIELLDLSFEIASQKRTISSPQPTRDESQV